MESIDKSDLSKCITNILIGSVLAIIITLILLLAFSAILTYTDVQENTIQPVVIVITVISILIGSGISTRKIKKRGLINGGIVGLLYVLTLYLLSSFTGSGFELNVYSIMMVVAGMIAGVLGGIIGVNIGK